MSTTIQQTRPVDNDVTSFSPVTRGQPAFLLTRCGLTALAFSFLVAGCTGSLQPAEPEPSVDGGGPEPEPDGVALGDMARSTRNDLRWNRARSFENGVGQALLLDQGQVCDELGRYSCVDTVHLVALGGNDPYDQGLYEPPASPGATTSVAIDRLLLSACLSAVEKERTATPQLIFLDLDLTAATLDFENTSTAFAVDDTITNLFRRFHARDPLPAEHTIVKELARDASGALISAAEFAMLACFAVGSTTEAIFY